MALENGIAIRIKAFLPMGKTLDEQLAALTLVKRAHETGDYAALLTAAKVEEVATESKTRRTADAEPALPLPEPAQEPAAISASPENRQPVVTDEEEGGENTLAAAE